MSDFYLSRREPHNERASDSGWPLQPPLWELFFARANMLVLCNIQSNLSPFSPLLSIAFPQQPLRSSITEQEKKEQLNGKG